MDAIRKAIRAAKARTDMPTLIRVKAIIGYGTFNKADNRDAPRPGEVNRVRGRNGATIDGRTELSVTEDGAKRYEAYR